MAGGACRNGRQESGGGSASHLKASGEWSYGAEECRTARMSLFHFANESSTESCKCIQGDQKTPLLPLPQSFRVQKTAGLPFFLSKSSKSVFI